MIHSNDLPFFQHLLAKWNNAPNSSRNLIVRIHSCAA